MSLVGAVSLTNKEGLFLGSVNLDNLNLEPNQLVYSADGINMSGLNISAGLEQVNNDLLTIGNPNIQLTSNSIYCNDNIGSTPVQTAVNSATQSDVIYISSGSYGEPQVVLTNKYNMAINCPAIGTTTICELLNGINIDNTNELIRISNLSIKTSAGIPSTIIKPIGRTIFHNVIFVGSATVPHIIEIGEGTTKYMTFNQVEFDQDCTINISSSLGAPIYFTNCNFGGATINFANASPLLVIMNNCAGLVSYPSATKATLIGLNVLTTGESQVSTTNVNLSTINGSAYPPSGGVSITNQAKNRIITATATTDTLNANQDATWDGTQLILYNSNFLNIGRGNSITSDSTNTAIGVNALNTITTGINNTVYGYNSGSTLTTQTNNTIIGSSNGIGGNNNTLVGYNCLTNSGSNQASVSIGATSKVGNQSVSIGSSSFSGDDSVSIGSSACKIGSSGYNVIVGSFCGNSLTSGNGDCLIGSNNSQNITSGINNTILGISAGAGQTTQSNNSICGYYSNCADATSIHYSNCSILGSNIRNGVISGNNQVQLGDSSTNTYIYGVLQIRSDSRDKNCIRDTILGLDFINELRPVDYKWDLREDYKQSVIDENHNLTEINLPKDGSKTRNRYHHGLIAQEVKMACDKLGVDFGGYQNHQINGGYDRLSIGYEELICPLIKAVQELKLKNEQLEERIKVLESK